MAWAIVKECLAIFFFHFGFNAIEIDIIRLPVQRASTKLITLNKTGIPATSQFPILFNPRNLSFQVEGCRNRLCLCKDHRHEGCSSNVNISSGRLRAVFVSKFIPMWNCSLYLRFMSGFNIKLSEDLWIPDLDMTSFRLWILILNTIDNFTTLLQSQLVLSDSRCIFWL